jgi:S1-C subfamily serine protease
MFDAHGDVIGINAQIRSESGNAEGVGFAVPINAAKRSMAQLIETGRVRYAWLGVTTQTVTSGNAKKLGYSTSGAAVADVVAESPAAEAGLRGGSDPQQVEGLPFVTGGDLIVAIDGRPVKSAEDVVRAITQRLVPGQRVEVTYLRDGDEKTVTVVLGERPEMPPSLNR